MSETADRLTRSIDDRSLSARGFFDIEPVVPSPLPPPQLGPPPHLDPPAAVVPVSPPSPAVPQLPRNVPAVPSPAPAASPFAFSPAGPSNAPGPVKAGSAPRRGGRRTMSWLLVLAIVGGGVYAGITYGPDLVARAKGEPTISEPVAPLAFPTVTPAAVAPRTATFLVQQPNGDAAAEHYELTHDFETGISRLFVDRADRSDIEVLAVFDMATLREADQPTWWSVPRGELPFVGGPERQRWLRTVDDYFPAPMRAFITIDQATEAVLGTETMRHLVVTVDAASIARLATDPLTGAPIPPATLGEFVLPATVTATPETLAPLTVEMWVDANGMIRKLVEPEALGGRTVTVTSLSPEAFSPTFPEAETVAPLTAGQFVDFAL